MNPFEQTFADPLVQAAAAAGIMAPIGTHLSGGPAVQTPPHNVWVAEQAAGVVSAPAAARAGGRARKPKDANAGKKAKSKKRKAEPKESPVDDKRMKFLERNRAAATRCRERKKQFLQELQSRANTLAVANSQMQSELSRLRDEVAQLKMLMLAHKGCNITQEQAHALTGVNVSGPDGAQLALEALNGAGGADGALLSGLADPSQPQAQAQPPQQPPPGPQASQQAYAQQLSADAEILDSVNLASIMGSLA